MDVFADRSVLCRLGKLTVAYQYPHAQTYYSPQGVAPPNGLPQFSKVMVQHTIHLM